MATVAPDILWHNASTGETQIWFMDDHKVARRATVVGEDGKAALVGPPWAIVGASDFDRDGTADILWHNASTDETQIWFMDDHKVARRATVVGEDGKAVLVGPPWAIVGTAGQLEPARLQGVLTQHNDAARTGSISHPGFTPSVVESPHWGRLRHLPVDAAVYAQPLFVHNVKLPSGAVRHIVLIATARNTLYAYDATSYELLWTLLLGQPDSSLVGWGNNEIDWLSFGNAKTHDGPGHHFYFLGIQSTPVIDSVTGRIYVSYRAADHTPGQATQWLAAVDLPTGRLLGKEPIGRHEDAFKIEHQRQRASLLLSRGVLFIAFGSRWEGNADYHGWVFAHDAKTLRHVGGFNTTPTSQGGGIWQASGGLAADSQGRVYFMTGNLMPEPQVNNGRFDVSHMEPDANGVNLGNSFVRLDVTRHIAGDGSVERADINIGSWFTPYRAAWQNSIDLDLGSAGIVLIPGTRYLAGGGKEGILYLLNRENLGGLHRHPTGSDHVVPKPHVFAETFQGTDAKGAPLPLLYEGVSWNPYTPNDPNRDAAVAEVAAGRNEYLHDHGLEPSMNLWGTWPHIHSSPVFADLGNGRRMLYVWPEKDYLKGFALTAAAFGKMTIGHGGPRDRAPDGMPGATLSAVVASDHPGSGVVFASVPQEDTYDSLKTIHDERKGPAGGEQQQDEVRHKPYWHWDPNGWKNPDQHWAVHAYDASSLRFLWADTAPTTPLKNLFAKWVSPTIADSRVFLATFSNEVLVYGRADYWQGPTPVGRPTLPPGTTVALASEGSPALAVDSSGSLNVAWDVGGTTAWEGPVPFGGPTLPPGCPVAVAHQTRKDGRAQLTAVAVDMFGQFNVGWSVMGEAWEGPVPITGPDFPPGAAVSLAYQGSTHQLDALLVDNHGAVNVLWVADDGTWAGPQPLTRPDFARPGAHIALGHQGSTDQLDALVVDNHGALNVLWTYKLEPWAGPKLISPTGFAPPGAHIALGHQGSTDQLDALVVDNHGALNVLWTYKLEPWAGPERISPTGFAPPGACLAVGHQWSGDQLDALVVDNHGALNVLWTYKLEPWAGPARISPTTFPPGSPIAAAQHNGQLRALVVDTAGRLNISWVVTS
jgi:hypothetical protein